MPLPTLAQSPTDPGFVQDPYPFYARARAAGPLVHWQDYGLACATTHDAINAVLRDRRMGREAPAGQVAPAAPHTAPFYAIEANSMLELEPPRHTRLRGLVLRAFTTRRIAALAPEIEALCHRLIDAFPPGAVDLIPAYAREVPVIVIARLLGVPETVAPQLLDWSNAMVAMYQARRDRAVEETAASAAADFAAYLRDYVETRRATPGDDLISHLIAAEADGARLTTDELIATCILLLNAGHEATVHTIGNGVKLLLENGPDPAWLAAGQIAQTVEEILRLDPPLHMFTRWVYEDLELHGQSFVRGDRIACLMASAGRDAALLDAPDRFDPLRPDHPHLAFGAGIHFCVGAPLARLELQIALKTLIDRCPTLALAADPRYADLYHFHGLTSLAVTR